MGLMTMLGWREWVALPMLGIAAIRCKIDSGARSSALHVDALTTYTRDGIERVRFSLQAGDDAGLEHCDAPVHDRRQVTDSGGHVTERCFIVTELELAGMRFPIEINLTNRRNMLFPMLLGRTAMSDRFSIDPSASFLLGEPQSVDGAVR